ncbi:glycosyl hydrolase family 3 N terminal domain-containing protein [Emericellopsis atlantica]|uniref:Probable beta-glucosidase G n=1 Tax=Emericellopsis atlantica TaxID=2614577 RepID=A0A9P7ZMC4_9HYPO|nr:glycosyl hydrolase family 3 N terminal domain-containing protein [Emericellopsis atlantica]KAG9254347.1 glycosyl hydrolase family 3 N terminal domain-containing protein [Emericellopsis atlantica]
MYRFLNKMSGNSQHLPALLLLLAVAIPGPTVAISGVQSVGVQACVKHHVGNEQETQRTLTTNDDGAIIDAVSANINDRTLHELYLWPFANAVQSDVSSIMCSYNRVNGKYTCANPETLGMLRDELAFPGYIVSDWYSTHSTIASANAGLDVEMPGNFSAVAGEAYFGDMLLEAVSNQSASVERLDEMVERVTRPYYLLGQDGGFPTLDPANAAAFVVYQYGHSSELLSYYPLLNARDVRGEHAKLTRELGSAATVLLKNENDTLPLKAPINVGIFGNGAPYPTIGSAFLDYGDHPEGFEMGTVDIGGGSGTVRHTNLVAPLEAIRRQTESYGGRVQVLLDNTEIIKGTFRTIYPVPDVCLVFLKAYATEGQDRQNLDLEWEATTCHLQPPTP